MNQDGGQDLKPIEDAILAQFPDWKRVTVNINYVPPLDSNNPQDATIRKRHCLYCPQSARTCTLWIRPPLIGLAIKGWCAPRSRG